MRHLILAAALVLPTGSSFAQPASPAPNPNKFASARLDCQASRVQHADLVGRKPSFNRLGELPPADLMLAVVREVDGCQEPVVVGQGYGALAQPNRRGR